MIIAIGVVAYLLIGIFAARRTYAYWRNTGEPKFCLSPGNRYHQHYEYCYGLDSEEMTIRCVATLVGWPAIALVYGTVTAVTYKPHESKNEKLNRRNRELEKAISDLKATGYRKDL